MTQARKSAAWYLVQTKPRQERTALVNLERQGYRSFLPLIRLRRRHGGRAVTKVEAMFPRYLFVHLTEAVDNFAPIRSTIGVANLVRFGQRYAQVPETLVTRLSADCDENGIIEHEALTPTVGDSVVVLDGPFAGYEAILAANKPRDRVAILLQLAGRHVQVELSLDQISRRDGY